MKKVLVSGSSGFIGFHLIKKLIKKNKVLGIDNHNNYYSKKIKNNRLKILLKKRRFIFKKIDLNNSDKLEKTFKKFRPQIVYHLAGQPGVLYSFKNPKSYFVNNIKATKSISEISKKYNVEKFIFGSSSSVYGDQKKFPIKETFKVNPKNPYAKTKLESEKIVIKKFKKSGTKYTIFRFFTVFGPFGRPDMFIHKFLNSIKKNQKIKLYNNGFNLRDFTYIDDVVEILSKNILNTPKSKILNICRSKPIITTDLVSIIEKIYKKNIKIQKIGFVKGEMLKTHGSNKLLKRNFQNVKFTDIKYGLKKTIKFFKKYSY